MNQDVTALFSSDLVLEMEDVINVSSLNHNETGIKVDNVVIEGIPVSDVTITNLGEKNMNKKAGRYLSFHLADSDSEKKNVVQVISHAMAALVESPERYKKILVVGLGNYRVTPDAFGPGVINYLNVTEHLDVKPTPSLSTFVPGVMGVTGLETEALIKGVVNETRPELVILIDALKARHVERVNRTIQLTNTGIQPGSGVGQKRQSIDQEYLGVPVISMGIPTVVDAVTVTYDAMTVISKYFNKAQETLHAPKQRLFQGVLHVGNIGETEPLTGSEAEKYFGLFGSLSTDDQRHLINEVLTDEGRNLIVTPKSIDEDIHQLQQLLAKGIHDYIENAANRV